MKTNEVNKEISYETLLVTFGEGIGRLDTMFDAPDEKDVKEIIVTKAVIEKRAKPTVVTNGGEQSA